MITPSPHRVPKLHRVAVFALTALLLAMLWGFAGVAKLTSGGVPAWFTDQFNKTFLANFPGLAASYYSIALLESFAAILALLSLLRGEFIRVVTPFFLYLSLLSTLALFVQLSLGKQLLADFDGIHDLYMYFTGTLVILYFVRHLDATSPTHRTTASEIRPHTSP